MTALSGRIGSTPDIHQIFSPTPSAPPAHDLCRILYKTAADSRHIVSEGRFRRLGLMWWGWKGWRVLGLYSCCRLPRLAACALPVAAL